MGKAGTLSFGLVGCGDIAESELTAIRSVEDAEVTVAMDVNLDYARSFASRFGVQPCGSWAELLSSEVDVVVLAVPHYLHRKLAVEAAWAGKHVILEKPIATTRRDAQEIIETCRTAGVLLSVAYVQRYRPANQRAREIIRGGAIGRVMHIHLTDLFRKPESYWSGGYSNSVRTDWRAQRVKSGGGVFIMNGSHSIDYLLDMTGLTPESIFSVCANRATPGVEVEDDAAVILRFKEGSVATICTATIVHGDPRSEEIICGDKGTLRLGNPLALYIQEPWGPYPAGEWVSIPVAEEDPWQAGRNEFFQRFAAAVRGSEEVPIPGEEALGVLDVVLSAYDSSDRGVVAPVTHFPTPGQGNQ